MTTTRCDSCGAAETASLRLHDTRHATLCDDCVAETPEGEL